MQVLLRMLVIYAVYSVDLHSVLTLDKHHRQAGNAPRNGIVAALLAERGFAAAARTLNDVCGFIHVTGEQPDRGTGARAPAAA